MLGVTRPQNGIGVAVKRPAISFVTGKIEQIKKQSIQSRRVAALNSSSIILQDCSIDNALAYSRHWRPTFSSTGIAAVPAVGVSKDAFLSGLEVSRCRWLLNDIRDLAAGDRALASVA
jgi:hypothetical protein